MKPRRAAGVTVASGAQVAKSAKLEVAEGGTIVLEDGCEIGDGCRLLARGAAIRVGAGAVLEDRCTLVAHAGITIGPAARLGDGAMAVDFDHATADVETPVRLQGLEASPVAVGARVRIGPGASLLRGVTIGDDAEVGAHAVVTCDVPAGDAVVGVPGRAIAFARDDVPDSREA